jgi:hypothetical protein
MREWFVMSDSIRDRARELRKQEREDAARREREATLRADEAARRRRRDQAEREAERRREYQLDQNQRARQAASVVNASGVRELLEELRNAWGCGEISESYSKEWGNGSNSADIRLSHSYSVPTYWHDSYDHETNYTGQSKAVEYTSVTIEQTADGSVDISVSSTQSDLHVWERSASYVRTTEIKGVNPTNGATIRSFIRDSLAKDLINRERTTGLPRRIEAVASANIRAEEKKLRKRRRQF